MIFEPLPLCPFVLKFLNSPYKHLKIELKENEIESAVERLQSGQVIQAEREIAHPGITIGISNKKLSLQFSPAGFAAGELI